MVSYTSEDGENREEGNFFKSFCLLTQCQEKDRAVFSAREVTNAWERSERIPCRKVKIEKKRKKRLSLLANGGRVMGRKRSTTARAWVCAVGHPEAGRMDAFTASQSLLTSSRLISPKTKSRPPL